MVVYIDILFIENFIINCFLLTMTIRIIKQRLSLRRIFLSGGIGALYTFCFFLDKYYLLTAFPAKLIISMLLVYIVIGRKNHRESLKAWGIFILLSLCLSGVLLLLSQQQNSYSINDGFILNKLSIQYIFLALMFSYIFFERAILLIKDRTITSDFMYEVSFEIEGNKYKINAFLDSGNELREPVTALPVIIVEEKKISNVAIVKENAYRIPYNVVNGNSGYLYGIRVNGVKLFQRGKLILTQDMIICTCSNKLSKEDSYEALLSRRVL